MKVVKGERLCGEITHNSKVLRGSAISSKFCCKSGLQVGSVKSIQLIAKMSKKTVELFYDVVSPYTWFAFEVLMRYQNRWNINLKLRPFFLGGLNAGTGNKPPIMVPAKAKYMPKDILRLSKYFDVPVRNPKDEDITEPASLTQAAKLAGLSEKQIAEILPRINSNDVKERLKQTTQEALDLGAFGSPTIVAHVDGKKEWVFGSDRFPILADLLGEKWEGPLPGVSSKL